MMHARRWTISLLLAFSLTGSAFAAEKSSAPRSAALKTRQIAASISPEATTALTSRHGLKLPAKLTTSRPVAVLVHGLDSSDACWVDMVPLLERSGCQVGYFSYPNDQPLAESGRLLASEIRKARRRRPALKLDLVAHSMGGLVARSFVEGSQYKGGVRRLILIATPNQGSEFSRGSCCSEIWEHYNHWRNQPGWSWTWTLTDGLGEAGADLRPGSAFLNDLNARPRREGVQYSVVYGNRNCGWRYGANALDCLAGAMPGCDMGQCMSRSLSSVADRWRSRESAGDGLVSVKSAKLEGVDDQVGVSADHITLCCSEDGEPPRAWPVLRRLLALAD